MSCEERMTCPATLTHSRLCSDGASARALDLRTEWGTIRWERFNTDTEELCFTDYTSSSNLTLYHTAEMKLPHRFVYDAKGATLVRTITTSNEQHACLHKPVPHRSIWVDAPNGTQTLDSTSSTAAELQPGIEHLEDVCLKNLGPARGNSEMIHLRIVDEDDTEYRTITQRRPNSTDSDILVVSHNNEPFQVTFTLRALLLMGHSYKELHSLLYINGE